MNWPTMEVLNGLLECVLTGSERADVYRYLDNAEQWQVWIHLRSGLDKQTAALELLKRLQEIIGANRTQLIEKGLI